MRGMLCGLLIHPRIVVWMHTAQEMVRLRVDVATEERLVAVWYPMSLWMDAEEIILLRVVGDAAERSLDVEAPMRLYLERSLVRCS